MDLIRVNEENIDKEHICCAIADKKGEGCVASKKKWLKDRFSEGLVFEKLDARGKVFIEYIPVEHAWAPVTAENAFYINCLWVSGQYKGQGYADQLLDSCIENARAQNKQGIVALSSAKKKPFLSDPDYLKKRGFIKADQAAPDYELLFLPLVPDAIMPRFNPRSKVGICEGHGFVLYYTNQCPHTDKYAPLLSSWIAHRGLAIELRKIEDRQTAQSAPCPFTTYSLYYEGKFVTNEILSEKRLEKILAELGL